MADNVNYIMSKVKEFNTIVRERNEEWNQNINSIGHIRIVSARSSKIEDKEYEQKKRHNMEQFMDKEAS